MHLTSRFWVQINCMELQEIKLEETSLLSERDYFCIFFSIYSFLPYCMLKTSPAPKSKLMSKH